MTGFWVAAALVTAGIVALLIRPLIRKTKPIAALEEADLAVYRDQLAELERDRARGLVEPDQAASLETEIGRRMLSVVRGPKGAVSRTAPARWLTAFVIVVIPVASLWVYLTVGRPELPGQPLAGRTDTQQFDPAKLLAAIGQMKAKLTPTKDDLDGWVTIAQAYRRLGYPRDAADALRTAASIAPDDSTLSAALAETLVEADGGAVGEEAKNRFTSIPADSPARPEARFYLALADAQAGNMQGALAGWQSLLADSPPDAAWIEATKERIAAATEALGRDPNVPTPAAQPTGNP